MERPRWAIHPLLRMLPRVDAALMHADGELTSNLIA
jgi:hypothetical protein